MYNIDVSIDVCITTKIFSELQISNDQHFKAMTKRIPKQEKSRQRVID